MAWSFCFLALAKVEITHSTLINAVNMVIYLASIALVTCTVCADNQTTNPGQRQSLFSKNQHSDLKNSRQPLGGLQVLNLLVSFCCPFRDNLYSDSPNRVTTVYFHSRGFSAANGLVIFGLLLTTCVSLGLLN